MSTERHYTIPIFVPEMGCPHQCVFCNQRKISGSLHLPDAQEVETIIEKHLSTIPRENSHIEIGFFGGNFTGIDIHLQKKFLSIASRFSLLASLHGIRISTRPDYIDEHGMHVLKDHGVTTIELGAQSMDNDILKRSGRGHTAEDTERASAMILEHGFKLGLQMMLGLPGDTLEKSLRTARRIVEMGADNIRIYPTLVIKDTVLAKMFLNGTYAPLSLEEAVRWSAEVCRIFDKAGINIIRMGLHPSEGLISGTDLLAGPYHTSFRELVETALWQENFKQLEDKRSSDSITIHINPDQYNVAIGYKATNKKMLLNKFKRVKFVKDGSLEGRNFYVDYC